MAKFTPDEIRQIICTESADQFSTENVDVSMSLDDLGCDSLDGVEFIMRLEEIFSINIPDSDLEVEEFKHGYLKWPLEQLVALVEKKL